MPGKLEGRVALITGTSSGQGRAAAIAFAREGAIVVGCGRNVAENDRTVEEVVARGGRMSGSAPVNLADAEQARRWVEDAAAAHGRIDIVYNNASSARFGPIDQLSVEDWHFTIANEVDLIFFVVRAAWPHLARQGGVILNTASVAAHAGSRASGILAHAAAKGAVVAMTRQMAAEGAKVGIRAVSISPTVVETPTTRPLIENDEMRAHLLEQLLVQRPGQPEDVVEAAVFLASHDASFITGSDILVDGGQIAV